MSFIFMKNMNYYLNDERQNMRLFEVFINLVLTLNNKCL